MFTRKTSNKMGKKKKEKKEGKKKEELMMIRHSIQGNRINQLFFRENFNI